MRRVEYGGRNSQTVTHRIALKNGVKNQSRYDRNQLGKSFSSLIKVNDTNDLKETKEFSICQKYFMLYS